MCCHRHCQQVPGALSFAKAYAPNFLYFNKKHAWAEQARAVKTPPGSRLGPAHGEWVVPAVDIKLSLAEFHRQANASSWVRRQPVHCQATHSTQA